MGFEDDEPIYGKPAGLGDPSSGHRTRRGDRGTPGFPVRLAAVVAVLAVVAAVAGGTAGWLLVRGTPGANADQQPGASPSASAPESAGSAGLPALPTLSGQGNGQRQLILTGRVLAVSGTSITIGGDGPSATAAITRSTKVTGAVHGIGGVKAGTEVSAQLTGTSSHLTATAIQDPALS